VNGNHASYEGKADAFRGVSSSVWGIAHELNLWSPKGFLTGKAGRTGSVLVGYRFARADARCGVPGCDARGGGSSNHYYENEWDIWYWVRPTISVGMWVVYSQAANMRVSDQITVGCAKNSTPNNAGNAGQECGWTSVNLGLRTDW